MNETVAIAFVVLRVSNFFNQNLAVNEFITQTCFLQSLDILD